MRNVPDDVDRALRERARSEGKSLNETLVDALRTGLAFGSPTVAKRDLSDVWGHSEPDPEMDAALAEFRQIDWEEWA